MSNLIKYKSKKEKISIHPKESQGYIRDIGVGQDISIERKRREYGAHLTSVDIFKKYIFS